MALLKLPLRFVDEANANSTIEACGLFPIGARAVQGEYGRWFVVIDARQPESTLRYLKQHMPGVEWRVMEESP